MNEWRRVDVALLNKNPFMFYLDKKKEIFKYTIKNYAGKFYLLEHFVIELTYRKLVTKNLRFDYLRSENRHLLGQL